MYTASNLKIYSKTAQWLWLWSLLHSVCSAHRLTSQHDSYIRAPDITNVVDLVEGDEEAAAEDQVVVKGVGNAEADANIPINLLNVANDGNDGNDNDDGKASASIEGIPEDNRAHADAGNNKNNDNQGGNDGGQGDNGGENNDEAAQEDADGNADDDEADNNAANNRDDDDEDEEEEKYKYDSGHDDQEEEKDQDDDNDQEEEKDSEVSTDSDQLPTSPGAHLDKHSQHLYLGTVVVVLWLVVQYWWSLHLRRESPMLLNPSSMTA